MAASSAAARPKVTVAGLGPGRPGAVTEETRTLMAGPGRRFLRTRRHPTADGLPDADSFDELYERADSFDDVYDRIADKLAAVAHEDGHVSYFVPGSPLVLERSVRTLRARDDLDVELLPAVSFLDEVWSRLGVDPVDDGVRLVDGHRFEAQAAGQRGPLLVAHVHAPWVLFDIKLAWDGDSDPTVVVIQRLGTADEHVAEVAWSEMDRQIQPDHLTSLYIPELDPEVGASLIGSVQLMERLRAECPWDMDQDHASLRKYLMEEAYEVLDALDLVIAASADDDDQNRGGAALAQAYEELEGELGDLWFQILFHSRLAAEHGQFTVADVAQSLTTKMVRRHPHVFETGGGSVAPEDDAMAAQRRTEVWETSKREETGRTSAFDGIPSALPALSLADKVLSRAVRALGSAETGATVQPLQAVLSQADDDPEVAVGKVAMAVIWLARGMGVDAELALRAAASRMVAELRTKEQSSGSGWVVG